MSDLVLYFSPIHYMYRKQRMQHLLHSFNRTDVLSIFVNPPRSSQEPVTTVLRSYAGIEVLTMPTLGGAPLLSSPWASESFDHYASIIRSVVSSGVNECQEIRRVIAIYGHPSWCSLLPNFPEWIHLYDRLDRFDQFDGPVDLAPQDKWSIEACDGVIYTSDRLAVSESSGKITRKIPNGVLDSFLKTPNDFTDDKTAANDRRRSRNQALRKIGYVGAIDSWFDFELLIELATVRPDLTIRLAGSFGQTVQHEVPRLGALPNIELLGEIRHVDVPAFYDSIDLQIVPFIKNELTDAVDAVKVYEAASRGLLSLTTNLDGMCGFPDHVVSSASPENWLDRLAVLESCLQVSDIEKRISWAANNCWGHRAREVLEFANCLISGKMMGHIIIGFGEQEKIVQTVRSLVSTISFEAPILVVDNGIDEAPKFFEWVQEFDKRVEILSPGFNLGYAGGANFGLTSMLERYPGLEFVAVHNDDLYFTFGWETAVKRAFSDCDRAGAVTPSSCGVGSENRVPCKTPLHERLELYANPLEDHWKMRPVFQEVRYPGFFSVAFRREALLDVGLFDESFGIGYYEDDDWSERARQRGWCVGFAGGAFVHHSESKSFGLLGTSRLGELRAAAQARFREKHLKDVQRVAFNPEDFL